MRICQSDKFDPEQGEWCILNDYGNEGLAVYGQYDTPEEAVLDLSGTCGAPQSIVRIVDFSVSITDHRAMAGKG